MFKTATAAVIVLAAAVWASPALAYPYLYVPDAGAGKLTVVDAQGNTIVRSIANLPGALGVAISANGNLVYVTEGTSGKVAIIDSTQIGNPNQNPVIGQITGLGDPVALALSPDGNSLFAADAQGDQALEIDLKSRAVTQTFPAAGAGLSAMALGPAGLRLALASGSGASAAVRLYTLSDGSHVDIPLPATPRALVFSSTGQTLWIATDTGLISYDPVSGKQTSVALASGAGAIAYAARTQSLYVAARSTNTLYVVPAAGGSPTPITLGGVPTGVALSPDGTRAYASFAGGLDVVDTKTAKIVDVVSLGQQPAVTGNFSGPGNIWAANTATSTSVGAQISGTVQASDYLSRPLSYAVIEAPASGTLNFTAGTGGYTYTPVPGSSGIASFVWEATAASGTGSPTTPRSPPITTTMLIHPVLSAFANQQVNAGATLGPLDFTLQGSLPLAVTTSSSNPSVIDPAKTVLSSGCGTATLQCTLTLTAGNAKGQATTVTVTATDPSGLAADQSFRVSINGSGGGGGGGGSLSWLLLAILAGLAATRFAYRRTHEGI